MKNTLKAIALAGFLGASSCSPNHEAQPVSTESTRQYADDSVRFSLEIGDIMQQDTSIKEKMLKIYGHDYSFPIVNSQTKKKIHDALLQTTAGVPSEEVWNIILRNPDIQKIFKGKDIIGSQELNMYIESILLQSKLFYEGSSPDHSLVGVDSILKKPVDKKVFEPLFGKSFDLKNIDVTYISTPSQREGTSAANTVILNTLVTGESIEGNKIFTQNSNPQKYTQAVINNEVIHTYLRQKYGKITDAELPIGHLIFQGNPVEITALDIAEYLSDVASVNTDITYFSTPLSLYLGDEISGTKTYEHYKMSKIMTSSILGKICASHTKLGDTLALLLEQGKEKYKHNTESGASKEKILQDMAGSEIEYLKTLYTMMTPEIEQKIKELMNSYGKELIQELDKVKKEINSAKAQS